MTALPYALAFVGGFLAAYGLLLLSAACAPTGGGDGADAGSSSSARRGGGRGSASDAPSPVPPTEKCSGLGCTPQATTDTP